MITEVGDARCAELQAPMGDSYFSVQRHQRAFKPASGYLHIHFLIHTTPHANIFIWNSCHVEASLSGLLLTWRMFMLILEWAKYKSTGSLRSTSTSQSRILGTAWKARRDWPVMIMTSPDRTSIAVGFCVLVLPEMEQTQVNWFCGQ